MQGRCTSVVKQIIFRLLYQEITSSPTMYYYRSVLMSLGIPEVCVANPKLAAYCTAYFAYCEHVAVSANRAVVCGLNGAVPIHSYLAKTF